MHRKVAAALVAALALAVASCGGSETETLTGAALVRRIETACREGERASAKQSRTGPRGPTGFVAAVLAGQRAELDALDNVNTTGAAKGDFEAFKKAVKDRIGMVERVASADRADIQRAMAAVQREAEAATRTIEDVTRRLGVKGCT